MNQVRTAKHTARRVTQITIGLLFLCISSLIGSAHVLAGDSHSGSVGFRAGLTLSDWRGDTYHDSSVTMGKGLVLGAFRSFRISEGFEFQPELLITMRKIKLQYRSALGWGSLLFAETATLYYLEVPVLARFPVIAVPDYRSAIYIGPVWAISVGGRRSGEFISSFPGLHSDSYSGSIPNTNRLDFGVVVGFELRFSDKPKSMILDVRYVLGLKNSMGEVGDVGSLADDQFPFADPITGYPNELKNGSFMITLGLSYPRKR